MQPQTRSFQVAMQDFFQICKSDIFKASKKPLAKMLSKCICYSFENYFAKMPKNCLCEMSYIPIYQIFFRQLCNISSRFANPISFRPVKEILPRCFECLHKTSLRHLQDVFLPNVYEGKIAVFAVFSSVVKYT